MEILHIVVLALIQGITEFLPISSSAHLILPSQLLGWPDQGLAFDVALHFGSLVAVVTYFRNDLRQLFRGWFAHVFRRQPSAAANLAWAIMLATLPAVLVGWWADDIMEHLRTLMVMAVTTFVFGILLGIADRRAHNNTLSEISHRQALFVGFMQCLALIPGVSRSGITMTAALMVSLSREAAARFSFLLSIPLIVAATTLKTSQLVQSDVVVDWSSLLLGGMLSAITAFLCIKLFLESINRIGFMPFVVYRIVLGMALLGVDIYFAYSACQALCASAA